MELLKKILRQGVSNQAARVRVLADFPPYWCRAQGDELPADDGVAISSEEIEQLMDVLVPGGRHKVKADIPQRSQLSIPNLGKILVLAHRQDALPYLHFYFPGPGVALFENDFLALGGGHTHGLGQEPQLAAPPNAPTPEEAQAMPPPPTASATPAPPLGLPTDLSGRSGQTSKPESSPAPGLSKRPAAARGFVPSTLEAPLAGGPADTHAETGSAKAHAHSEGQQRHSTAPATGFAPTILRLRADEPSSTTIRPRPAISRRTGESAASSAVRRPPRKLTIPT